MPLYQNKYKTQSVRHKNWDYSQNGYYFVTICTKDMQEFFGEISDGEMNLFEIGKIVNEYWQEIPKHFPFVKLHEYIVMPNHIHGIVEINKDESDTHVRRDKAVPRLYAGKHPKMSKISPKPGSLSVIIGSFKSVVSKMVNQRHLNFQWQSSLYDRIIRDETALGKIREYIERNPKFWDEDKNKVENIFY